MSQNEEIKVTIECNENQAIVIQMALDFMSRLMMGQVSELNYVFGMHNTNVQNSSKEQIEELIRKTYFPRLPHAGSYYGIFSDECPQIAKEQWDMIQVIRHALAWYKNPEGGNTVNFGMPIASSMQPLCKVTCSGKE